MSIEVLEMIRLVYTRKRGHIGEDCCWTPTDLFLSVFKLNPHTESVQQLYATQMPFIVHQRLLPKQTNVEHSPIGRLKFKCSWVKAWPQKNTDINLTNNPIHQDIPTLALPCNSLLLLVRSLIVVLVMPSLPLCV